jgi:hypothetical protein
MRSWMGVITLVLPLFTTACDDTVFTFGGVQVYDPTIDGVQDMFDDKCGSCHPGTDDFVFDDLIADVRDETEVFVVAGSPADSYFWRKLSNTMLEDEGSAMPLTGVLKAEEISHVERWILDGAPLGGE